MSKFKIDFCFKNKVKAGISGDYFRRILEGVFRRERIKSHKKVNLILVDDEEIRELNKKYLHRNYPTDVLSFSFKEDRKFVLPGQDGELLGEVIISYPTALQQAKKASHSVKKELTILFIHGLLHLLGYDHGKNSQEANRMKKRENTILNQLTI